jgi:o-succinylbenzoate synthase
MRTELLPKSLRLKEPLVSAHGTLLDRLGFDVRVTFEGITGRGEVFPLIEFGTESLDAAKEAVIAFTPRAFEDLSELPGLLSPLDPTPAARFAMECALLEWLAKKKGLPVASLMGEARTSIPVNALIAGRTAEILAEAAKRAKDAGFGTVKLKVGAKTMSLDAQRVHAVRLAVGNDVAVRLDANGGWTEGTARAALRGLESLGVELCEQPVAAHDVEGLRRVTELVPVPVAADEALSDRRHRENVLRPHPSPAAKVLVLKPAVLGGLLPALALARAAHAAGVESYVTTLIDGPIARAAAAHLAAVVPSTSHAHGLSTLELFEGMAADALTPRNGNIELSAAPGWGV